ncbi:MAG TPA: O-antigen ligase family protein, partial [Chloroflexota bacterium]|nr:O-antigen ligase family protein [Chloroflexota bacterium]
SLAPGGEGGMPETGPGQGRGRGGQPTTNRSLSYLATLRRLVGDPVAFGLAVAFVGIALVSLTASVDKHQSLQSLRTIIVEPVALYLLIVTRARRRSDMVVLAGALVLAGVAISLVGGWQYLTNERIITAEADLRRIRGFYGSPNNLALFLGRALPFGLAFALFWRRGRFYWTLATAIMALAMVLTFSLGGWFAIGLAALVVAGLHSGRTFKMAIAIGVVGLLVGGVVGAGIPRIASHFDLRDSTTFARLDLWQSALHMLRDHPVRGIGLDNFLYYYQHGYRLPSAWEDPDLSHPHNILLDFWLSLGLPGFLLLLALAGWLARAIARGWRDSNGETRGLYAAVVGALVDLAAHGMVDNSYFLPDLAVLFWLMFAIVTVLQREQLSSSSSVRG